MDRSKLINIILVAIVVFGVLQFFNKNEPTQEIQNPVPEPKTAIESRPQSATPVSQKAIAGSTNSKPTTSKVAVSASTEEVKSFTPFTKKNKWLMAKIIDGIAVAQGDMILGRVDDKQGELDFSKIQVAKVEPNNAKIWPSNIIPIVIDQSIRDPEIVFKAIESFHQKTNVRFVELNEVLNSEEAKNVKGHILFTHHEELCASYLGFQGGEQQIFIKDDCSTQAVRHEIMHALGFPHEQSREDRDDYLKIIWENIDPTKYDQFAIIPENVISYFKGSVFNFSYNSIMIYPDIAFSIDGSKVTMSSTKDKKIAPELEDLSPVDATRVNYLYGQ